ncbi:MAG: hypothetical protein COT74_13100 [Bdellovibrionales bacterium CG10_big_fil_rev_8_21_14_0_10_45_34]|nr:MAG: hypothetical protein COT74_13100 [Bdellovibrionales bacterium CG10_big_fil_rev_8_21_14_0_10_45_34]
MKSKLLTVFKFVFSFSAVRLGLIITGFLFYFSTVFYRPEGLRSEGEGTAIDILHLIHQKSVDIRMVHRGYVAPDDRIVLLTVDENSLQWLGRWPWSRDIMANVVEKVMEFNIKAIGFDIVFPESEKTDLYQSLEKIKSLPGISPQVENTILSELKRADKDRILGETIAKHSERIVTGGYFDTDVHVYYPYQSVCFDYLRKQSHEYKFLEGDQALSLVLDSLANEPPEFVHQFLSYQFKRIDFKIRRDLKGLPDNVLSDRVFDAQQLYCTQFLAGTDDTLDEFKNIWPNVQKAYPDFSETPFEDFVSSFQTLFDIPNQTLAAERWWLNVPDISEGAAYFASFNAYPDKDGVVRRAYLVTRYSDQFIPSLALKLHMLTQEKGLLVNIDQDPIRGRGKSIKGLDLTNSETGEVELSLPADRSGRVLINYHGPKYTYPHLSAGELFSRDGKAKVAQWDGHETRETKIDLKEYLQDKILLFGATAVGIFDLRVTPFSEDFPGLETHANALDNILNSDFLVHHSLEPLYMPFTLLALGVFLSLALARLGAIWGFFTAIFTALVIYLVDRFYFFASGYIIAVALPLLLTLIMYMAMTAYKYLTEERKKKELKGTFAKYVSPAIVDEILKSPENLQLGGRKIFMSVLFSDVRGFTTISEKLDPQQLTHILNTYLTPMTRLVFKNKGTLDKYMGDAIMAFFGAPITYDNHAEMACRCALDMMSELKKIQTDFETKGLPLIDIGIGINSGEMNAGNMGSDIVRSYTVMGDSVNLGSRLEGINKQYGTHIIISEFTLKEIGDKFVTREIDSVRVKGKLLPVRIHELMNTKEAATDDQRKLSENFDAALQLYYKAEFDAAMSAFTKCLDINPDDDSSKLYINRCSEFLEVPPPKDWDGVFEMKSK